MLVDAGDAGDDGDAGDAGDDGDAGDAGDAAILTLNSTPRPPARMGGGTYKS